MPKLTDQLGQHSYKDPNRQRLYLKDIDCPQAWRDYLNGLLPGNICYLNDSIGDYGGPGAIDVPHGPQQILTKSKSVAPAGDLMSSLPPEMRAENLMCYIGHEGTYTPAHREMCASLGQNIMVEASGNGLDPWGKQEREGSSIWFMTETKDRYLVSEYWMSILGHDIEVESHFAQINAWKNAPFTTHIVTQRPGDFILIPPLAPHQVWNRGTRTMKVAWNRTTVETLEMALNEALPRARMVCRDEQYKNKAIIYYSLGKYSDLLDRFNIDREDGWSAEALAEIKADRKVRQVRKDFRRLFQLYTTILLSEMFSPDLPKERSVEFLPYDSNVTCAYCRCNIFNRFLTCPTCINELESGGEDAYDVCMECYAMGRSCACISNLKWVEQFQWKDLTDNYDRWRMQIIHMEGTVNNDSPQPLPEARKLIGKKTLAQVCQEQLKIRPWRDITRPPPHRSEELGLEEDDESEVPEVDDEGRRKTRKKRRSEKWKREHINCHICKHREFHWKLARCQCGVAYCYGVLFRAFDLMPQDVMEDPDWKCPRCLKICSCAQCRRDGDTTPYEPTGTLVGHDTKRVADPRSVESLVDFSRSNLLWIRKSSEDEAEQQYETARLRKLKKDAQREKEKDVTLNEAYVDDDDEPSPGDAPHEEEGSSQNGAFSLDPKLSASTTSRPSRFKQHHKSTLPPAEVNHSGADQGSYGQEFVPVEFYAAPPASTPSEDEEMATLERDPDAFMADAGLGEPHSPGHEHLGGYGCVAPDATMIANPNSGHGHNPWPSADPGLRDSAFALGSEDPPQATASSDPMGLMPNGQLNESTPDQNRRRPRDKAAVESEGEPTTMQGANRQFSAARLRRTLDDAKKNDSYTMTQARLKQQRKIVKLPIQGQQLAGLENEQQDGDLDKEGDDNDGQAGGPAKRQRRSVFGGDGSAEEESNVTLIVESDAPKRIRATLPSAVLDKTHSDVPINLFARKKPGRPKKSQAPETTTPTKRRSGRFAVVIRTSCK